MFANGNKWVLICATVVAVVVIGTTAFLTYEKAVASGTFDATVLVILTAFGFTGAVHMTGDVIARTNGTSTTVVPVKASGEVGPVTTVPSHTNVTVPVTVPPAVPVAAMPQPAPTEGT